MNVNCKWNGLRNLSCWFAGLVMALASYAAIAGGEEFKIPTSREGVLLSVFWEAHEGNTATVLLFTGGEGGYGKLVDGRPSSINFLTRSLKYFVDNGFNVLVFGKPTDMRYLDGPERTSDKHIEDVKTAIAFIKSKSPLPIFIVGTSMGTISTTTSIINIHDPAIAGAVLTSSVLNYAIQGAVPGQKLSKITIPVLVVHHAHDACKHCPPYQAKDIVADLKNAPIKKLVMVEGGGEPSGDPCQPMHHHGFTGQEEKVVDMIAVWIRNPTN